MCARNKLGTVLDPRIFIFPCFDEEPSNIGRKLIAQDEKKTENAQNTANLDIAVIYLR